MILHSFVMRPVPHLEIVQVFPSQPRNRQYAKERKYQGILRVYIYIPCSRTVAGATLYCDGLSSCSENNCHIPEQARGDRRSQKPRITPQCGKEAHSSSSGRMSL